MHEMRDYMKDSIWGMPNSEGDMIPGKRPVLSPVWDETHIHTILSQPFYNHTAPLHTVTHMVYFSHSTLLFAVSPLNRQTYCIVGWEPDITTRLPYNLLCLSDHHPQSRCREHPRCKLHCLHPKQHPIPHLLHYFWLGPIWSKEVHYIVNKGPFGKQPQWGDKGPGG